MAVKLRLKKAGSKRKPHFKIIVCEQHTGRDSRAIEELGFYDPSRNPPIIKLNRERADYWVKVGAQMSPTVKNIVEKG